MSLSLKSLAIILLVSVHALLPAMDEPFHCKVPLQHITTHPNQKQEKATKLTQAQLDAIQFAKEQETKKLIAARNKQPNNQHQKISCGLKELLKDQIIKGESFKSTLIDSVPSDVQKEIVKLCYSPTAYSNGYQLFPALIPHCPKQFFSPAPWKNFYTREHTKKYKSNFLVEIKVGNLVDRIFNIQEYERNFFCFQATLRDYGITKYRCNDYTRNFFAKKGIYPYDFQAIIANDILYLSQKPTRDLLENCSTKQLNLIRELWIRNEKIEANWRYSRWYNQPILLNAQETKTYLSLPEQLRISLETNYKIKLHSPWVKQTLAFLSGCGLVAGYMASTLWKKA